MGFPDGENLNQLNKSLARFHPAGFYFIDCLKA